MLLASKFILEDYFNLEELFLCSSRNVSIYWHKFSVLGFSMWERQMCFFIYKLGWIDETRSASTARDDTIEKAQNPSQSQEEY